MRPTFPTLFKVQVQHLFWYSKQNKMRARGRKHWAMDPHKIQTKLRFPTYTDMVYTCLSLKGEIKALKKKKEWNGQNTTGLSVSPESKLGVIRRMIYNSREP